MYIFLEFFLIKPTNLFISLVPVQLPYPVWIAHNNAAQHVIQEWFADMEIKDSHTLKWSII